MNRVPGVPATLAVLLYLAAPSPALAACTLDTQVVFHGLDSYFQNCADAHNILGYAYLISAPGSTNSNGQDLVCEDGSALAGVGALCPPQAGTPGDGVVAIYYDWGSFNTGSLGCPNPTGSGDGTTPIGIQVVDNSGEGLVVSISYSQSLGGFLVEQAQPYNPVLNEIDPISCAGENGPQFAGYSGTQPCFHIPVPTIHSDCDPGTVGDVLGLCAASGASRPTTAPGNIYYKQADCGSSPDPRTSAGWTAVSATFEPAINAYCFTLPTNQYPYCQCQFIGVTGIIGGVETPAILAALVRSPCLAAVDQVAIDSASFARGRLKVAFSTRNEATIVAFNVYAGTTRLNASLIPAQGAGSNSYQFEVGRGAVRASRSVIVEAVKSDGTITISAPHPIE
jgi:hypothetical protein